VQVKAIAVHSMLVVSVTVEAVEEAATAAEVTVTKRHLKVEKTSPQTR
jgi:hypothetical protein